MRIANIFMSKQSPGSEADVVRLLSLLKQRCAEMEQEICGSVGLSRPEYACISCVPLEGSVRAGELSRCMGLSPSRSTRIVDALVGRGLLGRAGHDGDRRVSALRLTRRGRSVRRRVDAAMQECGAQLLAGLSAGDRARVERGLSLFLEVLEERRPASKKMSGSRTGRSARTEKKREIG